MTPTTLTTSASAATADQLLDASRLLAPELAARAQETEQLGTMPADLVARVQAEGLFRCLQPRSLGGAELSPHEVIEIVSTLCEADGSSGWTILIGIGGNAFAGWLDPGVARDLLGADADTTTATVFAPTGRAVPEDAVRPTDAGCLVVSGRWPFASGCRHAAWFLNGVFVSDANGPRLMPGRGPDWRLAYLPRADVQIIDGWDVMGLRGTGSNDVAAQAVRVAEEHTISPFFEPARHDGPLWRLPFFTLAGVALAGFPLGVARRALDALAAAAPTTGRAHRPAPLAEDATVQIEMARAEGALQAAEAFVRDAAGSLWDTAVEGDVPSVEQRARFQLSVQAAMHAALQAVDMAYTATGSRAISSSHPLQRCFRDLHVAAQHAYFSPDALERYAKVRLHIEQPLHML